MGLMRVNLYKDQISPAGSMPPLPNDKALFASLRPAYNVLKAAGQQRAHGRPMYAITDDQKKAADSFLKVIGSLSKHEWFGGGCLISLDEQPVIKLVIIILCCWYPILCYWYETDTGKCPLSFST